jgi:DNA topoisomerase IB
MYISISAIDKHSADSFMKALLTMSMSRSFNFSPAYKRSFSLWFSESLPFVKRFKLPLPTFKQAYTGILSGIDCNTDDAFHAVLLEVFNTLRVKTKEIKAELDLRKEDVSFIRDCRLYYVKHSESAYKNLHRAASRFGESDISAMFVTEHDDISSEKEQLRALVKRVTGHEGYEIPVDKVKIWQKQADLTGVRGKDHESYLALRKPLTKVFNTRLQSLIRTSGDPLMLVRTVADTMDDEGIIHNIPPGFRGYMNDAGKYFTLGKLQMKTPPRGEVIMNDGSDPTSRIIYDINTDNTKVFRFKALGSKEFSNAYTMAWAAKSKVKKFGVVGQTIPLLEGFRNIWRADMVHLPTLKAVCATLVDFVDTTDSRVSSDRAMSKGVRTHGASTMQLKHVIITPTRLTVSYQGKSSGDQHHVIEYSGDRAMARLVKNFKILMKGKGPEDKVFTYVDDKGAQRAIRGSQVNKYMKSIGMPEKFTIHKFRTRTGMVKAAALLAKSPFKKGGDWTEKQVNDWVEEQMIQIGMQLGHSSSGKVTSSTAIQNYIEPELLENFYDDLGIRPSGNIQAAIDSIRRPHPPTA